MAYASISTYFKSGNGSILGGFNEKDYGHFFEFSQNLGEDGIDQLMLGLGYPHKIWVASPSQAEVYPHKVWVASPSQAEVSGYRYRYGKVLKTVAHIVADEADDGSVIVEKWNIKGRTDYTV
jgi:hypothetical protein|tara:strand:+ start:96 stop:461 length:366 start_codon:yes stop_codon:yes gene_type:complete